MAIRRTVYWSAQTGPVIPADAWLGIASQRFSPGVREMCCREALHCSFSAAAENLARTAQVSLGVGTVRTIVEHQGQAVLQAQRGGQLRPDFTVADCTDRTLISGADGVMVPLVTEQQKRKRRETEASKRRKEGRRSRARRGRPRRGSDGGYKEFKIVSFYDPDKSHCHVAGTAGDHEALGRLMRREAGRIGLAAAQVTYAVSDGAEWIANQYARNLPMLDAHILDYFHLREHVLAASQALYGDGTAKARNWCEKMMGVVWEQGSLVLLHRLGPYLRRHRGDKHAALLSLRNYVGKRVAMTDYPSFRALGYDCGSGPTESCCGTLTRRLKGPGMRWDSKNAEAVMALAAIRHSGQWRTYWHSERHAA
jgi:ribosomal protein L27